MSSGRSTTTLPFDRFIHEQLAADQLEPKVEPWRLAAMGFLTLGRQFDNNIHDIIDDRIDTVTRGLLGLTVGCARCHDHKYDPIPTRRLLLALRRLRELRGAAGAAAARNGARNRQVVARVRKARGSASEKMQKFLDSQYAMLIETARKRVGDYLVRVATTEPDLAETAIYFLSLAPTDLRPPLVNAWRQYLAHPDRAEGSGFRPLARVDEAAANRVSRRDAAAVLERRAGQTQSPGPKRAYRTER